MKNKSRKENKKEKMNEEVNRSTDSLKESDSSIRRFETGAIRDSNEGKEDYIETTSWTALKRFAQYMTGKKKKYGQGNFKKGISIDSYEQSLLRHVQKYIENKYEEGVVELDEDHLSAIVFNVFGIMHEEGRIKKQNHENRT